MIKSKLWERKICEEEEGALSLLGHVIFKDAFKWQTICIRSPCFVFDTYLNFLHTLIKASILNTVSLSLSFLLFLSLLFPCLFFFLLITRHHSLVGMRQAFEKIYWSFYLLRDVIWSEVSILFFLYTKNKMFILKWVLLKSKRQRPILAISIFIATLIANELRKMLIDALWKCNVIVLLSV